MRFKILGGLEMVPIKAALQLLKAGNTVRILCKSGSKLESEAISKNIPAEPLFLSDAKTLLSIKKASRIINEFNPEIIHTHLSHDLTVLVPALKLSHSSAKLFLTKHMASGVKKKDVVHKLLYKRVNAVFAVSNYIKQNVIDTCPVPEGNVHVLPEGIELQRFNKNSFDAGKTRRKLKLPDNKLIIGLIGRITPGKGHEEFLEAAKIINEKYNDRVFFLVTGNAGAGEEAYEKKIKKLSSGMSLNNILFTGFRSDIPQILSVIDILAFPSHSESYGITLLEAMAMHLPVVASNNSGIPDIVIDGETGILVPPHNSKKLAEGLMRLIDSKELRMGLGEAGRLRAEKFDADIIANKILNYYRK